MTRGVRECLQQKVSSIKNMIIIPAIDLLGGQVVRLLRGEYDKETVYDKEPLNVAKRWQSQGAEIIHIVDLDGSLHGELKNLKFAQEIIQTLRIKVHYGGGVRSTEDIKTIFKAGVHRVIIGTMAFKDASFLEKAAQDSDLKNRLDNIIVSIDAKQSPDKSDYILQAAGWTQASLQTSQGAITKLKETKINMAVVTDINRDGTLSGPNIELLESILKVTDLKIIASGGVSCLADIKNLKKLSDKYNNLYGAIIGKALYEERVNLKEAIDYAKKEHKT